MKFKRHTSKFLKEYELEIAKKTQNGWPDCPYCEDPFYYLDGHIDHIIPKSFGGTDTRENIILVCKECNVQKQNTPLHLWLLKKNISLHHTYVRLVRLNKEVPKEMSEYLGYNITLLNK
jgi:5-methylcytosine-specific restriction endonuclease McrA